MRVHKVLQVGKFTRNSHTLNTADMLALCAHPWLVDTAQKYSQQLIGEVNALCDMESESTKTRKVAMNTHGYC